MIVVRIELHSAVTGQVSEIGKMVIGNTGTGTSKRGNYRVFLMRRGTEHQVLRMGIVEGHPRLSQSVWRLVGKALRAVLGEEKALREWDALDSLQEWDALDSLQEEDR